MNKLIGFAAVLLLLLAPVACSIQTIEPGTSGVKKTLGKVEDKALPPGLYFYNPFTTDIIEMDNRVQTFTGADEVYTKDVQQVGVDYVLNFNLQADQSVKIYTTVGSNYANVLIPQAVKGILKNTIGKWDAIELVANRGKASSDIEAAIATELAKNGMSVTGLQLTNIKFGKEFEQAVEAKVTAVQQAEQSRNQTVQVQEQAKQRVISAQADAQAMQIQTAALKESQSLVLYEAVKKWNGVLPQFVTGENSNLLMQLPQTAK